MLLNKEYKMNTDHKNRRAQQIIIIIIIIIESIVPSRNIGCL